MTALLHPLVSDDIPTLENHIVTAMTHCILLNRTPKNLYIHLQCILYTFCFFSNHWILKLYRFSFHLVYQVYLIYLIILIWIF